MDASTQLRELLARQLDWGEAHVGFDAAFAALPFEAQGLIPKGFVHSAWQLLEHLRIAQADILDFCVNPAYVYPTSMQEYWPSSQVPPRQESWDGAVSAFRDDIAALKRMALDEGLDLFARVPCARSDAQTYARALILTTDHNAYHLGQLVALRRVLGCWVDDTTGPS